MMKQDWARTYVNTQVNRVRRMRKWAVSKELVSAGTWQALLAVEGLRRGRAAGVRENEPVKPAPDSDVAAVRPVVSRQTGAMIDLQLLTGMRPGEVVIMRGVDIDMGGRLWAYTPQYHKTEHHGHARTIYLGPKAQDVIRPFFKPDLAAYLFSPADAEAERGERRHLARLPSWTPLSCGNVPASNRVREPKRSPRARYTVDTYHQAIERGCDRAFPPPGKLGRAAKLIGRWRRTRKKRPLPKSLAAAAPDIAKHRDATAGTRTNSGATPPATLTRRSARRGSLARAAAWQRGNASDAPVQRVGSRADNQSISRRRVSSRDETM